MEKVNKQGQTLEQFLAEYNPNEFVKPAVTVDNIVFSVDEGKPVVLLVKRGNHPYIDDWAFPGGFVSENESCETAAERELFEETGLTEIEMEQLCTVSTPHRDIRGWTITNCFLSVIASTAEVMAADDASDAKWFSIDYVATGKNYMIVLKSKDDVTISAQMEIERAKNGTIDLNKSRILETNGIAFDHAKIILYAIEKL